MTTPKHPKTFKSTGIGSTNNQTNPHSSPSTSPWTPDQLFTDPILLSKIHSYLAENDLAAAISTAFELPDQHSDTYIYHAGSASVTLSDAQRAVHAGPAHGLHDWYACHPVFGSNLTSNSSSKPEPGSNDKHDNEHAPALTATIESESMAERKTPVQRPGTAEIAGYISLFDPSKTPANVLRGLAANAKKNSIQAAVAEYLLSKRYVAASDPTLVITARNKKNQQQQQQQQQYANIYIDFWAWSCVSLKWAGPEPSTSSLQLSHHVLPIFMHHFGCVCPSHEALELIRRLSLGRVVLDIGSGNGYWSYMLRRYNCQVLAIDNLQSRWRTTWIHDTQLADAADYIRRQRPGAGKDDVLLMVYPVVGLGFTVSVLDAYQGDVVCVAGTQNGNGYTGFKDETIDQWMTRERRDFEKVVQVPLPSFAGKDDALFVFRRTKIKQKTKSEK